MPLTSEQNELLTRVGPDSPTGKVLRRYWTPAFLASDLPEPDCPPIGVTILDEHFVAFRDSDGKLGFLDELCCHRGASLTYGRVEEGGIRCLYHAWKFATDGTILEAPNCDNAAILQRVKQGSYPVREKGGLGWVYLGPPEFEPPFPELPWMRSELGFNVNEAVLDCNWIQLQEGSLDSSHLGLLHYDTIVGNGAGARMIGSLSMPGIPWVDGGYGENLLPSAKGAGFPSHDNASAIYVEDTPFGFQYAAVRKMDDPTKKFIRITSMAFPYVCHIAGTGMNGAVIVVPRTDTTSSFIIVQRVREGESRLTPVDTPIHESQRTIRFPQDARGYSVPPQHRDAMVTRVSFAGFPGGNRPQDAAVQGVNAREPIYHRRTEHLVPSDGAILRFRNMIFENSALLEAGRPLLGLGYGCDFASIDQYSGICELDAGWEDLVPGNGSAGPLPVRDGESLSV